VCTGISIFHNDNVPSGVSYSPWRHCISKVCLSGYWIAFIMQVILSHICACIMTLIYNFRHCQGYVSLRVTDEPETRDAWWMELRTEVRSPSLDIFWTPPDICRTSPNNCGTSLAICQTSPDISGHLAGHLGICRTSPDISGQQASSDISKHLPVTSSVGHLRTSAGPLRTSAGHLRTAARHLRTSPDISGHLPDISEHLCRTSAGHLPDISGHLPNIAEQPDISKHLRHLLPNISGHLPDISGHLPDISGHLLDISRTHISLPDMTSPDCAGHLRTSVGHLRTSAGHLRTSAGHLLCGHVRTAEHLWTSAGQSLDVFGLPDISGHLAGHFGHRTSSAAGHLDICRTSLTSPDICRTSPDICWTSPAHLPDICRHLRHL
jgi:hypothetical protein